VLRQEVVVESDGLARLAGFMTVTFVILGVIGVIGVIAIAVSVSTGFDDN